MRNDDYRDVTNTPRRRPDPLGRHGGRGNALRGLQPDPGRGGRGARRLRDRLRGGRGDDGRARSRLVRLPRRAVGVAGACRALRPAGRGRRGPRGGAGRESGRGPVGAHPPLRRAAHAGARDRRRARPVARGGRRRSGHRRRQHLPCAGPRPERRVPPLDFGPGFARERQVEPAVRGAPEHDVGGRERVARDELASRELRLQDGRGLLGGRARRLDEPRRRASPAPRARAARRRRASRA